MKHTEYIIPIGEDAQDYDEMFIGVIRRQPELVRCKDCKWLGHYSDGVPFCDHPDGLACIDPDDYCSRAERKEE